MKKNTLSKILTLGVVVAPILVGTALVTTSSNITLNNDSSKNRSVEPIVNILTRQDAMALVFKKYTEGIPTGGWDGSLLPKDFSGITGIGVDAFNGNNQVTSITLPPSVTLIEANAFSATTILTTISALGVTTIDDNAFARTENIGQINLKYSENIKPGNALKWGTTANKLNFTGAPVKPTIHTDGIITKDFVSALILYENSQLPTGTSWDGILNENDLTDAISIAEGAFQDNTEIKSITLPDTVTSIGANAFSRATNLTTISALGVTSIGNQAFAGTTNMSNGGIKLKWSSNINATKAQTWGTTPEKLLITNIPNKPTVNGGIIDDAFVNILITYKKNTHPTGNWDGSLLESDFESATTVAPNAFQGNIEIKSITLPDTVTLIGDNAFSGAINLTTISALGATSIGANSFGETTGIDGNGNNKINLTYSEDIKLANAETWGTAPNKLNIINTPTNPIVPLSIDANFVNKLITYKKSMLPTGASWDGVLVDSDFIGEISPNSVAEGAFQGNTEIKSITLPNTILTIGSNAFSGTSNITTISILGATSIHINAFAGMTNMSNGGIKLKWSNEINATKAQTWGTTPEKLSFTGIESIPSITDGIIDDVFVNILIKHKINTDPSGNWNGILVATDFVGANSIADSAFQNRNEVTSITLPNTVLRIGPNAFNGASALTTISALNATSIGSQAFDGTTGITGVEDSKINLTSSSEIKIGNAGNWGIGDPNKLNIIDSPTNPTVPTDIDANFVTELIKYKKSLLATGDIWDGVLIATDFANATSITPNAFQGNTEIKSITLPDTVLGIGENAFNGMTSIIDNGINLTYSENIKLGNAQFWGTELHKLNIIGAPTNPQDTKVVTADFVSQLIKYRKSMLEGTTPWDGILIATDFKTATSIADSAFQDNTEIKSITLPNTVLRIGDNAFSGAINLTTISAFGATSIGTNAFDGMTSITGVDNSKINLTSSSEIKIGNATNWGIADHNKLNIIDSPTNPTVPTDIDANFVTELIKYKKSLLATGDIWDGVLIATDFANATSITPNAFQGNTEIKSITLPDTVLGIGENAFNGMTSIIDNGINLTYSENIKLGNAQFWGTELHKLNIIGAPTIPVAPRDINAEFVTELIKYKKSLLATGDIWDGVLIATDFTNAITINSNAFQDNTEIKSITLPNTVLRIGANAFNGASSLTTISALGVTSIGANAFGETTGITGIDNSKINLTYSEDIKLGNATNWGTRSDKLNIIDAPNIPKVPKIITADFVSQLIKYKKSLVATSASWDGVLVESDFTGATSIAEGAFKNNMDIKSITLPLTIVKIGIDAFSRSYNLKTISALGVTSIGANAFSGMTSITGTGDSKINLTYSENIKIGNAENWGINDNNKLLITNAPSNPTVPTDGIITTAFITELIKYKKSLLATGDIWDGILAESDFVNATSVDEGAFRSNTEIKSITLPNTVTSIGANAFSGMNGITGIDNSKINLTYSENIKPGNAQFWGTTFDKLSITNTPPNPIVPEIITNDFVNELITYKKTLLTTDVSWDGILVATDFVGATSIADGAFQNNTEIKSITLPDTVLGIGADAFSGMTGITGIDNSKINLTYNTQIKTTNIENWGTTSEKVSIANIPTNPLNPVNGVITPEFVNQLIGYKNSLVLGIWDGILVEEDFVGATSVAPNAFKDIANITSVTLPNTVTSIGANAFSGAIGLTNVSALGATSIGANAFAGMTNISNNGIKLTGSEDIDLKEYKHWGLDSETSLDITPFKTNSNDSLIWTLTGISIISNLIIISLFIGVFLYYRKKINKVNPDKLKDEEVSNS